MRILALLIPISLSACLGPMEMPDTMIDNSHKCIEWIAQAEIAQANARPEVIGDPTQALLALAIEKLGEQNAPDPYRPCYQGMEAFTQAYIATVQANASIINRSIGAATIPASILAGGWAQSEILQGAGSVVVDASNSDVSFDSGNVQSADDSVGTAGRQGASPNVNLPDNSIDNTDNSVDIDDTGNIIEDSGNTTEIIEP